MLAFLSRDHRAPRAVAAPLRATERNPLNMRDSRLFFALLFVAVATAAQAQPGRGTLPGQGPALTPAAETPARIGEARPAAPAVDNYKQTQHTGKFGGQTVAYTATAGTLALKSATGKPRRRSITRIRLAFCRSS